MGLEAKAGGRQTTVILTWKRFLAPAECGRTRPACAQGTCLQPVQERTDGHPRDGASDRGTRELGNAV